MHLILNDPMMTGSRQQIRRRGLLRVATDYPHHDLVAGLGRFDVGGRPLYLEHLVKRGKVTIPPVQRVA